MMNVRFLLNVIQLLMNFQNYMNLLLKINSLQHLYYNWKNDGIWVSYATLQPYFNSFILLGLKLYNVPKRMHGLGLLFFLRAVREYICFVRFIPVTHNQSFTNLDTMLQRWLIAHDHLKRIVIILVKFV